MVIQMSPFKIELTSASEGTKFSLRLEFSVIGAESYVLDFNNRACKLERQGLKIWEEGSEAPLEPVNFLRISPTDRSATETILSPKNPFVYLLEGSYLNPFLGFPGATYKLMPTIKYKMTVNYRGVESNEIEVIFQGQENTPNDDPRFWFRRLVDELKDDLQ